MSYTRVNWQNSPNTATPLSAENLNKMDAGIKQNADDIETLQQHTYDAELNGTSTNAPQNKAVYEAIQRIDIETDPTLTVSGKPADAAATGEAIANVSSAIDEYVVTDIAAGVTWVDNKYVNYSTGAIVDNSSAAYLKISLADETVVEVTSYLVSIYGVVFKDVNDAYISGYNHTTAGQYTDKVKVPVNAKYLYVSCVKAYKSVVKVMTNIVMTVEDLADKVADYTGLIADKVDLKHIGINIPVTLTSGMIKTDLSVYASASARHTAVTVEGGKKYRVTCYSSNAMYPGAFYVDGTTPVILLDGTGITYENQEVAIPTGVTTLYLNGNTAAVLPAVFEVTDAEHLYTEPNLYVELYDDDAMTLKAKAKSGAAEIVISFAKSGANNLPDFVKVESVADDGMELSAKMKGTSLNASTSDWFAPFCVQAVNNDDGDKPSGYAAHFTGGKHEYTNTGSGGTPTARCTSLEYYVNGNAVATYQGYANDIDIKWTNLVQGNNTKKADGTGREILQENHTLHCDGRKWIATVELIPLEDITMLRWYGFQYPHNGDATAEINYVGAVNRATYAGNVDSNSGDKTASEIRVKKSNLDVAFGVDPVYDCGARQFYNGTTGAFNVGASKKAYFWIIGNKAMSTGDRYYLKGYYEFALVQT